MKAVYIAEPGGPEKLIYGDRPDPEARSGKAKELGADAVINYTTTPNFSQRVKELTNGRGVDVVFDCVGAAVWDESLQSLKLGGRLVITGVSSGSQIPFNLSILQGRPLTLMGSGGRSRRSFAAMVHYDGLRSVVGQTFELAEVAKAHEVMSGRDFFGKLVLRVP